MTDSSEDKTVKEQRQQNVRERLKKKEECREAKRFDITSDEEPASSSRFVTKRIHDELEERGFDEEAEKLRAAGGTSQKRLARRLCREVLNTQPSALL